VESDDDMSGVMVTVPVMRTSGSQAASPCKHPASYARSNRKQKRRHQTVDGSKPGSKNVQPNGKYHWQITVFQFFPKNGRIFAI